MNDQKLEDYLRYFEKDTIKAVLSQIDDLGEIDRIIILVLFDDLSKTPKTISIFIDKIEGINELGFEEAVRRYVIAHITGDVLLACLMWVTETEITLDTITPPVKQSGLSFFYLTHAGQAVHTYAILDKGAQVSINGELIGKFTLMPMERNNVVFGQEIVLDPHIFKIF